MKTICKAAFTGLTALLAACSSDEQQYAVQPISDQDTLQHCTMMATLDMTPFSDDTETRASGEWTWQKDAVIYLQYYNGDNRISGHAVYTGNEEGAWDCYYNGTLSTAGRCEVYYFDGASATDKQNVTLAVSNAIWADTQGNYIKKGNNILLRATLKPLTARLRLKGKYSANRMKANLSGATHYAGYNAQANTLTTSSDTLKTTVGLNGYTDYMYVLFTNPDTRRLAITNNVDGSDVTFSCIFPADMLAPGKAGYINIPTLATNRGWTIVSGRTDGHEWVDLGLSVLWATMNVGANSPTDYGNYYAWGETTTKTVYNWGSYTFCNKTGNTMTKYCTSPDFGTVDNKTTIEADDDAATASWGSLWRTPTEDEMDELVTQCTWTWTTQGGHNGYRVTGPSGYSVFLPAAGDYTDTNLLDAGSVGRYFSSQISPTLPNNVRHLHFSKSGYSMDNYGRYHGLSVRPVTEP